ncbi:MAG: hypothetical protein JSW45_03800 [Thiotrichales bacterium]|nr:MAG: hypothetical protein JSW45_03800 [Thiotrichales bacterium]
MILRPLLVSLALVSTAPVYSEVSVKQTSRLSDTAAQAIKAEAIELLGQLQSLEQQLLYPAHTQVSVYLSLSENSSTVPQSISLRINDDIVTSHIYSQAELKALRAGGIQRLYTGNIKLGKHRLLVNMKESRKNGSTRNQEIEYRFNKNEKAEAIEIIVSNTNPHIQVKSRN